MLHLSETSFVVSASHFMNSGSTTDRGGFRRNIVADIPVFSVTVDTCILHTECPFRYMSEHTFVGDVFGSVDQTGVRLLCHSRPRHTNYLCSNLYNVVNINT